MKAELVPAPEEPAAPPRMMISPVVSADVVLAEHENVRALVADVLLEGRDFGKISGTQRKTLWKPGADRLGDAFGVRPRFAIVEREVDHDRLVDWTKRKWNDRRRAYEDLSGTSIGLYRYVIRCELIHRASGVVVGEAIGSASTMESRYVDRPRELENTVLKMAEKRAHVGAIVSTFGLAETFETIDDSPDPDPAKPASGRAARGTRDAKQQGHQARDVAASKQQISTIAERLADDRISDDERAGWMDRLERGLTERQANEAIVRIEAKLEERSAVPDEGSDPSDAGDDQLPF